MQITEVFLQVKLWFKGNEKAFADKLSYSTSFLGHSQYKNTGI